MRVVIASDADGMSMKESIKEMLIADGHEVVDYSETPAGHTGRAGTRGRSS